MTIEREKFGAFIRRQREAKDMGLREMAKKIGVSPTYLSKVERDEFPPPAEDKVRKIAAVIGQLKSDEFSFVFLRRLRFGDGRRPIAL